MRMSGVRGSPFGGSPGALKSCVIPAPQKIWPMPATLFVDGEVVSSVFTAFWAVQLRKGQPVLQDCGSERGYQAAACDARVPGRIHGALIVLGAYNNERRVIDNVALQCRHHLANRSVRELDFIQQRRRRGSLGVLLPACQAQPFLDQRLADADYLKVHAQQTGPGCRGLAVMGFAVDFVKNGGERSEL